MKRFPRAWIITFATLALSTGSCSAHAAVAFSAKPYDVWSIVVAIAASDIDGKGDREIVIGTVDSRIGVLDHKGRTLWEKKVGGIPSAVCIGDMDRDGKKEIAAVVQDVRGRLSVFDFKGNVLTGYEGDVAFLSIAMGDIDGDGREEVVAGDILGRVHLIGKDGRLRWKKNVANSAVGSLDTGDLNGDGKAEIVIGTHEDGVIALNHVGSEIWRVSKRLDDTRKFPSVKRSWIRSIVIDDIDLDGKLEVVSGSRPNGMVSVFDEKGRTIWQKRFPKTVNNYSTSMVAVGDLVGDGKKEIVTLFHGVIVEGQKGRSPISIIDHKGNVISDYEPDANFYGFCLDDLDEDGKSEMLTTSSTRGRRFYVLNAQSNNRAIMEGLVTPLADEMSRFTQKVAVSSGQKPLSKSSSPFQVLYVCRAFDPYLEETYNFLSKRESHGLEFVMLVEGLHEAGKTGRKGRGGGKRGRSTQKEILKTIQRLESRKIPFFLLAGAHCKLHIGLDTLDKILNVAPKQCRGFVFHEDSYSSKDWNRFVDYVQQILSLCKRHGGKKLILNEHQDFWYRVPALVDVAPQLFRSSFSDVLVPMYKTNRYVTPELNLGSILGLWKAGKASAWGFSTQDDAWKWESIFMVPPDDVLLRMEVLAASLGATYFRVERGKEFLDVANGKISVSPGAKRHRDLFHDLIRKNVIRPVENSTQVILSPVAVKQSEWRGWDGPPGPKAYWRHFYTSALTDRVSGSRFPLQTVSEEYLSGYVYGLQYYAAAMFPKTRYGFFPLIPEWIPPESIAGVRKVWSTDGSGVYDGKKKLGSGVAKESVLRSFEEMAETLPFRAEGVFLSAQKYSDDYLVYLMDPGCLDVNGVDTVLVINRSLGHCTVTDAISKEKLTVKNEKVPLRVPSGGFRILRVVPAKNARA